MNCPTAYPVDQKCVNLIHEYFNEMLKETTKENTYIEPKKNKNVRSKKVQNGNFGRRSNN
jgi:hypothetical protein